jgi:hypothetical protein
MGTAAFCCSTWSQGATTGAGSKKVNEVINLGGARHMTPEQVTALINLGAAGAVIATVIYFLRYISKRDDRDKERDVQWQLFFKTLLESKDAPTMRIAEILEKFYQEFQNHDIWEHTKLEEMSKAVQEPITQRRKPAPPK